MSLQNLLTILLIPVSTLCISQSLNQVEINSGGNSLNTATSNLIISLGGITNASYTKESGALSQGFLTKKKPGVITSSNNLKNQTISIFPNPANTEINFSGISTNETFTIFNSKGVKVIASETDEVIQIDNLSPGVYNIIFHNSQISNHTFIKL